MIYDPAEIPPRRRHIADRIENEHLGIYDPSDDDRERDGNHPREHGANLTRGGW